MTDEQTRALGELAIHKLVIRYCSPTIFAVVVNSLYNLIDRIFVGKFVGEDALAALTVTFTPAMFFLAFAMLIGQGSGALLSIKLGAKAHIKAEQILGQAFFLFMLITLIISTLGAVFTSELLTFFGAGGKILPLAVEYYRILLIGLIFEKISFGINNLIRAEGRPSYAMAVICMGGVVNVILDYVFIVEFGWGISGAAYATVAGQALASLWVMYFYLAHKGIVRLKFSNVRLHFAMALKVMKMGSPAFVIQSLASITMALQIYQAQKFGDESAVTTIGICMTVIMLLFLPLLGISMGIQPIVGYNWGAKDYPRSFSTLLHAIFMGLAFGLISVLCVQIFAKEIAILFLPKDTSMLEPASRALRICTFLSPCIGINIIASGYFQATGRPVFSIFTTLIRQMLILVPMLLILPIFFGLDGVWLSFPIADLGACIYSVTVVVLEHKKLGAS